MNMKPNKSSKIPCAVPALPSNQSSASERSISKLTRARTQYFPKSQVPVLNKSKVNFSMETLYNWEEETPEKSPKIKSEALGSNRSKISQSKPTSSFRSNSSRDDLQSMKESRNFTNKPGMTRRTSSKMEMTPKISKSSLAPCKIEKLQLSPSHDDIDGKEVCETLASIPVRWEELINDILAKSDEKCTDDFIENFDLVKKMTCDAVAMVAKYMQVRFDSILLADENKKLKNAQKQLNNRVASLNSKLTTTEATLKSLKSNFERDKSQLEIDLSRATAESARLKRDYQRQLKEKTAALGRITEELGRLKASCVENDAMKISVSLAESDDGQSSVATEDLQVGQKPVDAVKETAEKFDEAEPAGVVEKCEEVLDLVSTVTVTPETEVEALKSLAQRIDRTVAALSSQNASLRQLAAKSKDDENGTRLVKSLQALLRGNKKDSARLDNVVTTMKARVLQAQQQRSDIELRLAAMEKSV